MKFRVWEYDAQYARDVVELEEDSAVDAAHRYVMGHIRGDTFELNVATPGGKVRSFTVDIGDVSIDPFDNGPCDAVPPTGVPVGTFMIVKRHEFGGEAPGKDDVLIAEGIANERDANVMADALAARLGDRSEWSMTVQPDDYVLREFHP